MLQLGNENLFECVAMGCNLISTAVPERCCRREELELLRRGLKEIGISEEDALGFVLKLNRAPAAA